MIFKPGSRITNMKATFHYDSLRKLNLISHLVWVRFLGRVSPFDDKFLWFFGTNLSSEIDATKYLLIFWPISVPTSVFNEMPLKLKRILAAKKNTMYPKTTTTCCFMLSCCMLLLLLLLLMEMVACVRRRHSNNFRRTTNKFRCRCREIREIFFPATWQIFSSCCWRGFVVKCVPRCRWHCHRHPCHRLFATGVFGHLTFRQISCALIFDAPRCLLLDWIVRVVCLVDSAPRIWLDNVSICQSAGGVQKVTLAGTIS